MPSLNTTSQKALLNQCRCGHACWRKRERDREKSIIGDMVSDEPFTCSQTSSFLSKCNANTKFPFFSTLSFIYNI